MQTEMNHTRPAQVLRFCAGCIETLATFIAILLLYVIYIPFGIVAALTDRKAFCDFCTTIERTLRRCFSRKKRNP